MGGYASWVSLTNCLFERAYMALQGGLDTPNMTSFRARNCTMIGSYVLTTHFGAAVWPVWMENNAFDGVDFSQMDDPSGGNTNITYCNYNAFLQGAGQLRSEWANTITVTNFNWQTSWFGNFYLPLGSPLIDKGSTTADQVGLYHFTTQTNQAKEGTSTNDIGYHYVAVDANGNPIDTDEDGIPDYLEDSNGNGFGDDGETNWGLRILTQPGSTNAIQGNNVAFSATVIGVTPLSCQWFFNSTALAGATNLILTLNNVQTFNAGNYFVVITNVAGSVTSSVASLTLGIPPYFTTQPTNTMALAGQSVSFSALAGGTAPLNYQWYSNSIALPNATGTTLLLNNVTTNFAASYYVMVTNQAGSKTSSVVTLTVPVPPTITISGSTNQVVAQGSNVVFSTTASGSAPLNYRWFYNSTLLAGATNGALMLNMVQTTNSGNYFAVVTNVAGSATSSVVALTVMIPPSFTVQPTNQIIVAGSNVTINVLASGTAPKVQWYSNNVSLSGATNMSLTFANVSTNYTGNYFAVSTNLVGSATSSVAALTVLVRPAITQQPASQVAGTGSSVTFGVTATGSQLSYQWRSNGVNVAGANATNLTLNAVQTNYSGNYSVTITNLVGSVTSSVAVLAVYAPPMIVVQPTNQIAVAGSNVMASVVATGTQLTFKWYSNNVLLAGAVSPSLLFPNASTNISANYKVVVANPVGAVTSAVAALSVLDPLLDTDGDNLTDVYEIFVSHTDTTKWDSDGDGINDGDEIGTGGIPWRLEQERRTSAVIYANLPNAAEGGACGQCTVYLPSSVTGGATVQYRLGGSAVPGADFTITPANGSLTIPSGSTSGTISICAINDGTIPIWIAML